MPQRLTSAEVVRRRSIFLHLHNYPLRTVRTPFTPPQSPKTAVCSSSRLQAANSNARRSGRLPAARTCHRGRLQAARRTYTSSRPPPGRTSTSYRPCSRRVAGHQATHVITDLSLCNNRRHAANSVPVVGAFPARHIINRQRRATPRRCTLYSPGTPRAVKARRHSTAPGAPRQGARERQVIPLRDRWRKKTATRGTYTRVRLSYTSFVVGRAPARKAGALSYTLCTSSSAAQPRGRASFNYLIRRKVILSKEDLQLTLTPSEEQSPESTTHTGEIIYNSHSVGGTVKQSTTHAGKLSSSTYAHYT